MRSVLFYLPTDWIGLKPLPVFSFGAMVVVACAAGLWIAAARAKRMGLDADKMIDLCLYAMVAGIVGSRVTYLIFDWTPDPTTQHFLIDMIAIWNGGLTFQGGLILGTFVVWWYMHTHYLPVGKYLDAMAPAVLVGAGIGRVGCFLNGCCWGRIAEHGDAWGVTFPGPAADGAGGSPVYLYQHALSLDAPAQWAQRIVDLGYATDAPLPLPVWPTQLMETAGYLALAGLLLLVERDWRGRRDGTLMLLGLLAYSLFRFFIEFYRDDTLLISPLSWLTLADDPSAFTEPGVLALRFGQWVALLTIAATLAIWIVLAARRRDAAAEGDDDAPDLPDAPAP